MLFHFIYSCISSYIELNESTFYPSINRKKVALCVEFYGSNSVRPSPHFLETSNEFTKDRVRFARLSCIKFPRLCRENNITHRPSIKLYTESFEYPVDLSDKSSADQLRESIEENAAVLSNKFLEILPDLAPETIGKFFEDCKCCFVSFYNGTDMGIDLYNLKRLAKMFAFEPNVRIGTLNCQTNMNLCKNYDVPELPWTRIRIRGKWTDYNEEGWWEKSGQYLNEHCGTFRSAGGYLNDVAGTIPNANQIAKDFVQYPAKRQKLLNDMKRIRGSDNYVKVMERIMKNGYDESKAMVQSMFETLKEKNMSPAVLDQLKRRYNVCAQFFPTPGPLVKDEL